MPIMSSISCEDEYLFVKSEGFQKTISDHLKYFRSIFASAAKHKQRRILIDNRDVTFTTDSYDNIKIADSLESSLLQNMGFKAARIEREEQLAPAKFFETVVLNRSLNLKAFPSEREALDWLLS